MEGNNEYRIVSDSACDLTSQEVEERDITIVPFYISIDGKEYLKERVDIGIRELYEKMVKNPSLFPKTSTPSVQGYMDAFLPIIEKNKDIICICISKNFSSSYQSALNAREMILEDYPKAKIAVIDSAMATALQGLLVLETSKMEKDGVPFEKAVEILEKLKYTGRIFFTIGDLEYLKHGGRIGKLAGAAGGVLKVKPVIILKEGEIISSGIARSEGKAQERVIGLFKEYFNEEDLEGYAITLGFGYDYNSILDFKKKLVASLDREDLLKDVPIMQIGATIGVHIGPNSLGVGVIKRYTHYNII